MVQDYPDGFRRNLPGHTVDLESGFSLPWCESGELTIAAAGNSSFTLSFNDPDFIYFIDMINVSPQAYKEFFMFVYVNDVVYMAGANMGFLIMPLRTNPSINFLNGDSVKVQIYNKDSAQQTFKIYINGSKIVRPDTYGHAPGAHFSSDLYYINPLDSVQFTDESSFDPVSWEWDFNDGSPLSIEQNPSHVYSVVGTYYPVLKSSNQYGYDTYAEQTPILVSNNQKMSLFTEVDAGDDIAISGFQAVCTLMPSNLLSYVYRDFGASYFNGFTHRFCVKATGASGNGGSVYCWGLSNAIGSLYNGLSLKLTVAIGYNAGTYTLYAIGYSNTTVYATANNVISVNVPYYVEVIHVASSNVVTVNAYTDSSYSVLAFTLTLNHANNKTTWRYLYIMSSASSGIASTISAVSSNLLIS